MKWETHCSNKVECTLVNEKDVLDFERDFKIDAAYSFTGSFTYGFIVLERMYKVPALSKRVLLFSPLTLDKTNICM